MKKLALIPTLMFVVVMTMGASMAFYYFDASQITSGTLDAARLPTSAPALAINADQITGGALSNNRLPATINATTAVQVGGVSTLLPATLKASTNITWNTSEVGAVYPRIISGATVLRMKYITGTTAAAEGGAVSIAHGLTVGNIVSGNVILTNGSSVATPSSKSNDAGYLSTFYFDGTNLTVTNDATSSESILSWTIHAIIWYKE